ncbi:DUF2283 domain-containing protein [Methylomonas montana]|uniref:DUF2283 domain-containing protein n=1 Tax=Methylomonas montana TaxID=3058963 RepID=UPI002658FAD5|nr:DUF2283 domain-containing protein [Methylomonas montana]WKJ90482.1 DUF2283 domain-containing protein [Methylomonas montana]
MKITYFEDTDTLYIEFRKAEILETVDYDDNTLIDVNVAGRVCGITVEHAKQRVDLSGFSSKQISRLATEPHSSGL